MENSFLLWSVRNRRSLNRCEAPEEEKKLESLDLPNNWKENGNHSTLKMESLGLPNPDLTEQELEVVTTVFRNYETGLREATIYPKVRREAPYVSLHLYLPFPVLRI